MSPRDGAVAHGFERRAIVCRCGRMFTPLGFGQHLHDLAPFVRVHATMAEPPRHEHRWIDGRCIGRDCWAVEPDGTGPGDGRIDLAAELRALPSMTFGVDRPQGRPQEVVAVRYVRRDAVLDLLESVLAELTLALYRAEAPAPSGLRSRLVDAISNALPPVDDEGNLAADVATGLVESVLGKEPVR